MNKLLWLLVPIAIALAWYFNSESPSRPDHPTAQAILEQEKDYLLRVKSGDVDAGLRLVEAYAFERPNSPQYNDVLRQLLSTGDVRINLALGRSLINECMRQINGGLAVDVALEKEALQLLHAAQSQGSLDATTTLKTYDSVRK